MDEKYNRQKYKKNNNYKRAQIFVLLPPETVVKKQQLNIR